jgi:hypothetical protein
MPDFEDNYTDDTAASLPPDVTIAAAGTRLLDYGTLGHRGPRAASVPGYRREVSSATMSAADCDSLASATPWPAHIESASISPVVPAIGGAGS